MTRLARGIVAASLVVAAVSCNSGSGPVAGTLTVSLATPNPGADGAMLLTVAGPQAITSVTAATGLRAFSQPLSTITKVALTGPLMRGAVLTIGVADVGQATQYHATVQGVAASADFQLRPLVGYSLTVSR
jgi:hypothetical protein